jgi:periplasmic copper chaperone A
MIAWRLAILSLALASFALADMPESARTPTIRVTGAWIRWLPAGVPAAGYATLTNLGEKPIVLVGAASPYFHEVSMHRSVNERGIMQMAPVDKITIDPHATLEFAAGGYHFMLMQPTLSPGSQDRVPITLRFADGSSLTVTFEVRGSAAGADVRGWKGAGLEGWPRAMLESAADLWLTAHGSAGLCHS